LLEKSDLDDIAKRRCLMVLSVLSGETPVTDAIASANISRQMYYLLEERALKAMLKALTPGTESAPITGPDMASVRKIAELSAKVTQLEQDKRRTDRLLYLTRKVVKSGPMTTGARGRPPKVRLASEDGGPRPSPSSASTSPQRRALARPPADGTGVSIPTPGGEVEHSNGTES
jgi:hypothetical protein